MNSTKINSVQCTTLPTFLHSCLICTNLLKGPSARKTGQFSDNIKTFCEFFSLNKITCFDFDNRFATSLLCHRCRDRISLIAKGVREVNRLNEQLDTLRKSVCSDLTRVNSLLSSSVLRDVERDLNTQNSNHNNKSKQENQCEINLQQKFRKLLEERLTIPISWRCIPLVCSTQEASRKQRDCHKIRSLDHPKSVESRNGCVSKNTDVADKITVTVFPSSSNSLDRPVVEFQGVDYLNTESDIDFPEICKTSLDTITDNCNDLNSFTTHDDQVFEEEDIKIDDNEDVSSEFEMTAVDEIRTNSSTAEIDSSNANPETGIEVDLNRNHRDRNDTRGCNTILKSKNVSEPFDIDTQPPAEPPIKLKNAVVILTRLSPRSVAKLSRSQFHSPGQTKTGGLAPVSFKSDNLTLSSNSINSGQDTNTVSDFIKPANNELNSVARSVTLSQELIPAPLQESSTAGSGIEFEVENFTEFLDGDNIVEVEVATEADTTMQDASGSAKAMPAPAPAPSDKLNTQKAVLKFECPFIDPIRGTCPKRGRRFIDQERLDAHLNRMHYGKKKHHEFQCKQCHIGVESFKRLIEHEKIHSGVKDMICKTCGDSFRTEKLLLFHQRKVHGELYPFLCDVCSKGFNHACHLRMHILSHTGEFKFRCEECKAGFHYKSALSNHIIIHAEERQFLCQYCSKKFTTKGSLTTHTKTHLEDKAWLCDTCGKSFRNRDDLKKHWEVHRTDKSYSCQVCDFKTKTKASLRNHSRRYCKNRNKT